MISPEHTVTGQLAEIDAERIGADSPQKHGRLAQNGPL